MTDSLYDSFRWLDEDTDLDLSLDNYQQQMANSSPCLPPRRGPSFKRTLSFNSVNLSRKPISLASYGGAPISSPSVETQSVLANIVSRRSSISRPSSRNKPRHMPQSSTSSIDPSAQYFHDPEARLKLRVYLASPQNFDEAIEFGFPSLKENGSGNNEPNPSPPLRGFKGTFLDDGDDDASVRDDQKESCPNISRLSYVLENPQEPQDPMIDDNRQSGPQSEQNPQRNQNSREMTLRMTLTRPDLRADSCFTPTSMTDPTNLLQLIDDNSEIWGQDTDDQSLMKKMWRKLCKRKC
ncbi:hypothetical protein BJX99DRAFT_240138 [Aspergillus californicus]